VVIAAPATPWLQFERCVLDEDCLLESLQRLTRLDPQLVDEHAPCALVRVQGLRLSAGPVKREHQLPAKPLAQGVVSDQRLELGDEVVVTTERKIGFDPFLECRQAKLLKPGDLDVRERVECELRKRRAAPEGQRLAERGGGGVRVSGRKCASSLVEQGLEPMEVELAVGDRQDVAMGTGQKDPVLTWIYARGIVLEPSAQLRDERVNVLRRVRRRFGAPEVLDDLVDRHDDVGTQQEKREQGPLLMPAEREALAPVLDFERTENAEIHAATPLFASNLAPLQPPA